MLTKRHKKASILNLQPFGRECHIHIHIPVSNRPPGSKLLQRAEKDILVGYRKTSQQFRIYVQEEGRICVSADVEFQPFTAFKLNADRTPPSTLPQIERDQEVTQVTVTLNTLRNSFGKNFKILNLPNEQDSSYTSRILSHQQLSKTEASEFPTAEMLANHSNQENIIHSSAHPRRTVWSRVFDDTLTGDWWKGRRDPPVSGQSSVNSHKLNSAETVMISILDVSKPRSYHGAKFSVHRDEWKKAFDSKM